MIRLLGNLLRNREGVAATEFALIAPVFALFLAGVFDYGMYINTNMRMENTARSAAEYVIQGGDSGLISDDVITQSGLDTDNTTVTTEWVCTCADGVEISCDNTCNDANDYRREFIEVRLDTAYETAFPYPGMPDSINLQGRVRLQAQGKAP